MTRLVFGLIVWPFTVAWWLFVDYVWPYLWRIAIGVALGLAIGVALGLIFRWVYLGGEEVWPAGWWAPWL